MPLVEDGEVLTYVRNVGNRVAKEVGITTYQFQFFVVDQSIPNAFAVPGGNIFIYRGLIEMMSSEGELASILSHELAHIQARHLQRSIDEAKITERWNDSRPDCGDSSGGSRAGSRRHGCFPDRWPCSTAAPMKWKPISSGSGFFARQATILPPCPLSCRSCCSARGWPNSRVPSYLSTHPALGERVQYLS